MSVTFVKGGTTVTVRNPERSNLLGRKLHQAVGRTAGGAVYAYDKGVPILRMELTFVEIDGTTKGNLDSFFYVTAIGSQNTFTYTDHDAAAWTARFMQDELSWTEAQNGYWSTQVTLEVEAAV